MATLKDIAAAAGVSVRTVTRALYDAGYVRADRRERILALAAELGYRPDRAARATRTGRVYAVTAVINNVGELTAAKIAAAEAALRLAGYTLNLLFLSDIDQREDVSDVVNEIIDRRPAGVMFFNRPDRLLAAMPAGSTVPVVAVDMDSTDHACDTVSIDRQQGVYEAVTYLAKKGCKQIAYIGHHTDTRLDGYHRALQENRLKPILFEEPQGYRDQYEDGRRAAKVFAAMTPKPDAVQAYTDETALGFLAGLQAYDLKAPADVAVVGFDDRRAAALAAPPLTTVAQPNREVGEAAAALLLARIRGEAEELPPQRRVLATRLVIRETA